MTAPTDGIEDYLIRTADQHDDPAVVAWLRSPAALVRRLGDSKYEFLAFEDLGDSPIADDYSKVVAVTRGEDVKSKDCSCNSVMWAVKIEGDGAWTMTAERLCADESPTGEHLARSVWERVNVTG